jgi:hypothetical protein
MADDPQREESERLQKILQGAFSGPPTPLKDIPTRHGQQRAARKSQPDKEKIPNDQTQRGSKSV